MAAKRQAIILAVLLAAPPGRGTADAAPDGDADPAQELTLSGDFVAMAELRTPAAGAQLAVVSVDRAKPRRHRALTWYAWLAGQPQLPPGPAPPGRLAPVGRAVIPDDAAAYDVCRLDPASPVTSLVLLRPGGLYRLGDPAPLAAGDTLFAHARADALPRVRVCFDLFKGERPALVAPTLAGVTVYRAVAGGGYAPHARLASDAEAHYQGMLLRADDPGSGQRVSVRLEYPEVSAVDFDGDGRVDLCLALGETLTCYFQDQRGFAARQARRYVFDLLTDAERNDPSVRVESWLVDLNGDGLPDLILKKASWSIADMETSLYVFLQAKGGGFSGKPSQTLARKGYFAYQELVDLAGGGLPDLVAPVAALGWSDIVHIYLAKAVGIDFIAYRNVGGRFDPAPRRLHSLSYPVEFKNLGAILSALPLWDVRLLPPRSGKDERQVAFFPGKDAVEVYALSAGGEELRWRRAVPVGSAVLAVSLDGSGRNQLVFAYPRDPRRSDKLLFLATPSG